jgi:hypothetical protein
VCFHNESNLFSNFFQSNTSKKFFSNPSFLVIVLGNFIFLLLKGGVTFHDYFEIVKYFDSKNKSIFVASNLILNDNFLLNKLFF